MSSEVILLSLIRTGGEKTYKAEMERDEGAFHWMPVSLFFFFL